MKSIESIIPIKSIKTTKTRKVNKAVGKSLNLCSLSSLLGFIFWLFSVVYILRKQRQKWKMKNLCFKFIFINAKISFSFCLIFKIISSIFVLPSTQKTQK